MNPLKKVNSSSPNFGRKVISMVYKPGRIYCFVNHPFVYMNKFEFEKLKNRDYFHREKIYEGIEDKRFLFLKTEVDKIGSNYKEEFGVFLLDGQLVYVDSIQLMNYDVYQVDND